MSRIGGSKDIIISGPTNNNTQVSRTGTTQNQQMFNYSTETPSIGTKPEPEFVDQKTVTVKGDDGKKYKADQLITREVDSDGKTWDITTTTYTDADGNNIEDTVKTHVRTEKFGKKDVDITTQISIHKTPKIKRTVNSEESKYHYQESVEKIEYTKQGQLIQRSSSKKSKVKICKMPEGFNHKYLSTTQVIGRIVDGQFIAE